MLVIVLHPRAAVPIGSPQYAGESWLLPLATADSAANKAAQQVTLKQWSLNKLAFSVRSNIPVALVVNQCYDSGWKAKRGNSRNPVIDVAGLIGVPLPAGEYEVQLAYFPWSFIFGVVISLISLGVIVTMAFCLRKQPTTAKPGV